MKSATRGFSLFELMIVIALAAVILGLGAPSFSEFRRNNRLTGASNDFLSALLLARTEAIKRQQPVSLCASDNPQAVAPACSKGAYTGWIVFEDRNSDCVLDAAPEVLLRSDGPLEAAVKTAATGTCMPFMPTGFLKPQDDEPEDHVQRVLFCDERGTNPIDGASLSAARGVFVTPTGRARISRDVGTETETDLKKWAMTCP
ncbi:MAG TPA: GspH/FimT family pseudopilin [Steroidobacteraceae bacterium]|jgi:prepilin-type N-terminal cleavage/methylation domain-containing protein|nr:GspH/FimT family pseudopilin [Steroidobacteraceae bacterium]